MPIGSLAMLEDVSVADTQPDFALLSKDEQNALITEKINEGTHEITTAQVQDLRFAYCHVMTKDIPLELTAAANAISAWRAMYPDDLDD